MSSAEDKVKEILKEEIDRLIELQDQEIRIGETKTEIVERMARKLESAEMEPEKICRNIKRILKDNYINISDDTVEKACGITQKGKTKPTKDPLKSDLPEIEVSTSGSQSVTGPDGNEKEEEVEIATQQQDISTNPAVVANRVTEVEEPGIHEVIAERSAEIALNTIETKNKEIDDLKVRLNEAFTMIEDKDNVISKLRVGMGNMEIEVGELKKNKPAAAIITDKKVDEIEDLRIKYDELKQTYEELRQVEVLRTKQQDFNSASNITTPKKIWVAVVNTFGLSKALLKCSMKATDPDQARKKIVFDVTEEGQLKNPHLEGT